MPAAIVHDLHGKKVLAHLKNAENLDHTAFFWGCQGPDFLFCHRALPWMRGENIRHLAADLHKQDPNEMLCAMVAYVAEKPNLSAASYLLGFFCHYSLDSVAHPYIEALAQELLADSPKECLTTLHHEIESALDTLTLRSETEQLPSEIRLEAYFPQDENCMHMIASMYHSLCPQVGEGLFYQACEDAGKVFHWLSDKTGVKRFVLGAVRPSLAVHIRPLMEDGAFDYANLTNTPWNDRGGAERTESFFDLIDKATKKAVGIIDGFEKQNMDVLTEGEPF